MTINRSNQQWPEGFGLDMAGEVEQEWREAWEWEWLKANPEWREREDQLADELSEEIEDLTRLVEGAELRAGLRRVGLLP